MTSQPRPVERQPACRHLRSKGMYVSGHLDPETDDGQISDSNCWCNLTQKMLGPDDGLVQRIRCVSGRQCYETIL